MLHKIFFTDFDGDSVNHVEKVAAPEFASAFISEWKQRGFTELKVGEMLYIAPWSSYRGSLVSKEDENGNQS